MDPVSSCHSTVPSHDKRVAHVGELELAEQTTVPATLYSRTRFRLAFLPSPGPWATAVPWDWPLRPPRATNANRVEDPRVWALLRWSTATPPEHYPLFRSGQADLLRGQAPAAR